MRSGRANPILGGTVPVPTVLIDAVLPTLKDTELRVLLVVVRQTLGWRSDSRSGYKERDWMTHSQLMRRTNRASEAVSRAVDCLVQRGLIIVENAAGAPLKSAEERRRSLGRLYFRLGEAVDMCKTGDKARIAQAKTTTDTQDKKVEKVLSPVEKRKPESPVVLRGGGWHRVEVRT